MTKNDLEPEEVDFIKANYLKMSIKEMAEKINSNFYRVRNYMKEQNLVVDSKIIQEFRIKSMRKNGVGVSDYIDTHRDDFPLRKLYDAAEPKIDFWNHNLNPITMYRINH